MVSNDAIHDGKAEPASRRGHISPSEELFEHTGDLIGWNACPLIGNTEKHLVCGANGGDAELPGSIGVTDGIVQEVFEHVKNGGAIRANRRKTDRNVHINFKLLLA